MSFDRDRDSFARLPRRHIQRLIPRPSQCSVSIKAHRITLETSPRALFPVSGKKAPLSTVGSTQSRIYVFVEHFFPSIANFVLLPLGNR